MTPDELAKGIFAMGAVMAAGLAEEVPIPQLPPNPTPDDILRVLLANQQKLKPLMLAYMMATQGRMADKEKHREKAHEILEIIFDKIAEHALACTKGLE